MQHQKDLNRNYFEVKADKTHSRNKIFNPVTETKNMSATISCKTINYLICEHTVGRK